MIKLCAFADEAESGLDGQIAALKRNNIPYLELRSIAGKNVKDFSLDEAKEYAKILAANGISVWSIGSPIGKVGIDVDMDVYMKDVKHVCELANIFGTTRIRMFSFFHALEKREKVMEYLQQMVDCAKEYGVELYHENEKDIYGDILDRVLDIMQSVKGLKYIYDPANYLQCDEPAVKTLAALMDKTDYFHIKDVIVATGELVPAGYGDGRIDELVAKITGDKALTLEPHLAVFDAYASIDNSEMKHKFHFTSNNEAFDAAVNALKDILVKAGYKEMNGGFEKV
ncbi:MAG: sugar phosphate isomerase/epimerase [Clostridia bacterium]|nr:sugar phosphate isomerase/epimerase [Clostridia bacterium]